MLFVITATDKTGALDIRKANRPAHLEYLKSLGDAVVLAGPYLGSGEQPEGSMVMVKADGQAHAEAIAAADPYAKAGLFQSVTVRRWAWTINAPEGL